jgi:hypothetical protein
MKTIDNLQKDSLSYRLYDRIKNGNEHRTINEWAEEFDTLPYAIQGALGRLRKVNCHLHPVGTVTNPHGESKKGVIVDIMEKEEYFQEVYERGMKNRLIPGILDFSKQSEVARVAFPQLRHNILVAINTVYSYMKSLHDGFSEKPSEEKVEARQTLLERLFAKK